MIGAIVGVLFVLGAGFALVRPQYALLYIILLFPVKQLLQASFSFFQTQGMLINLVSGLIVGVGMISALLAKREILRGYWCSSTICLTLLYVVSAASIFYTPIPDAPIYFFKQIIPYMLLYLVGMPLLAVRLEDFRRAIPALLFMSTLTAILVVVHPSAKVIYGRLVLMVGESLGRDLSGNPLATAELGGLMIVIGALYRSPGQFTILLARVATVMMGLYLTYASGSRGQLLGGVMVTILLIPMAYGLKGFGSIVGLLAGVLVIVLLGSIGLSLADAEFAERWTSKALNEGATARTLPIQRMLEAYITSPLNYITGLGAGSFNHYGSINTSGENYTYMHNMFLEVLTELGLIGITLLLALYYTTIQAVRRVLQTVALSPEHRGVVAILSGVCLYYVFLTLKQGTFLGTPTPFAWMILTAKLCKTETDIAAHESAQYEEWSATSSDLDTPAYAHDDYDQPGARPLAY